MPVGIYGQTADMTAINRIAAEAGNLPVIEDAAQSFGATHHGKRSGALSLVGSTSFFPSKPLGGYGDGGALFTDDDELAERMRWIHIHGQQRKHFHPVLESTAASTPSRLRSSSRSSISSKRKSRCARRSPTAMRPGWPGLP